MLQTDTITWEVFVDLSDNIYVEYKYAILNTKTREIVYENGPNRKVRTASNTETLNVLHDHYFKFPVENCGEWQESQCLYFHYVQKIVLG